MFSLLYFTDVSGGPSPAPAPAQSDDFDMFAQSRKSFDQNKENMRCVMEIPLLLSFILLFCFITEHLLSAGSLPILLHFKYFNKDCLTRYHFKSLSSRKFRELLLSAGH